MTDPEHDHIFAAAEKILEDANLELRHGVRVLLYFAGGPVEPETIEGRGEWTHLHLESGEVIKVHTRAIVGWSKIDYE